MAPDPELPRPRKDPTTYTPTSMNKAFLGARYARMGFAYTLRYALEGADPEEIAHNAKVSEDEVKRLLSATELSLEDVALIYQAVYEDELLRAEVAQGLNQCLELLFFPALGIDPFEHIDDRNGDEPHWDVYTLSYDTAGTGTGSIGGAASGPYIEGTLVTLEANPGAGSEAGTPLWTGDVPVENQNDNPLQVVMDADRHITATFNLIQ
jgi:hypothetical protein